MKINKLLLGCGLALTGLVLLLSSAGIINYNFQESITYILLVVGFITVLFSFGNNRKSALFIGAASFFWGVANYILLNFEVLNSVSFLLPSILLIFGGALLMLFFDSPKEISFLVSALLIIGIGILFTFNYQEGFLFRLLNGIANYIFGLWPFFLIILGVLVLSQKREIRRKGL